MSLNFIDFRFGEDALDIPLSVPIPSISPQKRKDMAKGSTQAWKICGADTETIDGRLWLFSTEFGVWECNTLGELIEVLYSKQHARKWKSGRGDGRKSKRGISPLEFYFWNLKFDAQAVLHLIDFDDVKRLVKGDKVEVEVEVWGRTERIRMKYIEGKFLEFKPLDIHIGQYKLGVCYWWDISQFYNKMRLNTASKVYLDDSKIEFCRDGSILDASKFNIEAYREFYDVEIREYAIKDAQLCGRLARLKRKQFVDNEVRFIKPYSLANVGQRNLMDMSFIPKIDDFTKSTLGIQVLHRALNSYLGGWFETRGSGFMPNVKAVDLASAYPFIMYHLANSGVGSWVFGEGSEAFLDWLGERRKYQMGFAELYIEFPEGLSWYPLSRKAPRTMTLTNPRIVSGWFSADEIEEALKWNPEYYHIGEYVYHDEEGDTYRPFKAYIDRFYEMKMNSPKGSVEYAVSKVMLNSIYGKTIQCIDGKTGKMWNPVYASTITGGTRARLSEIIRLNGFSTLSVATDGVIFPNQELILPPRPADAPYNLGEWEDDGQGDLVVCMSGVYSLRTSTKTKTVFRGSASYFLKNNPDGLFSFCQENSDLDRLVVNYVRPYSAKESIIKNRQDLMNIFEQRVATLSAKGDSNKRVWGRNYPRNFGQLLETWFDSNPHEELPERI